MKKNLIAGFLASFMIFNFSYVAIAEENTNLGRVDEEVKENSYTTKEKLQGVDSNFHNEDLSDDEEQFLEQFNSKEFIEEDIKLNNISDEIKENIKESKGIIEGLLELLGKENVNESNKEYIKVSSLEVLSRVEPYFNDLENNEKFRNDLEYISEGVERISNKVKSFEDFEKAKSELNTAKEDINLALDKLSREGITLENKNYILKLISKAVERIKPYCNDLKDNEKLKDDFNYIIRNFNQISLAIDQFEKLSIEEEKDSTVLSAQVEEVKDNKEKEKGESAEEKKGEENKSKEIKKSTNKSTSTSTKNSTKLPKTGDEGDLDLLLMIIASLVIIKRAF